jgi:hypothetical protein
MADWYCGSTKWSAVTAWAASTAYSIGALRRQLATPTAGNERVFRCTTAGTSGGTEPSWTLTKGGTTNDGTAVWTEVTGNSTYGWTAAHAWIFKAAEWAANGDTVYVHENHAASRTNVAAIDVTGSSSAASPKRIICVNDGVTARTTTASEANLGSGSNSIVLLGYGYVYGVTFECGTGTSATSVTVGNSSNLSGRWVLERCGLKPNTTSARDAVGFYSISGTTPSRALSLELIDSVVTFASANPRIGCNGRLTWRGGSVAGTAPTALFGPTPSATGGAGDIGLIGVDVSAIGSGKSLFDVSGSSRFVARLVDCTLGAAVAVTTGAIAAPDSATIEVINADSANTNYRYARQTYEATETHETTVVRTGGASDGTTTISRKIVTTANVTPALYYRSQPIEFWAAAGTVNVSIPVVTDGVTLTNAEAWVEVEGLGTSGYPLGTIASDRVSDPIFGTPANQTTDGSSSWGGSLGSPVKQTLDASITTQAAGLVRAYVCVAKASTTLYYDPKALATSGRQYMSEAGMVNEGAAGGSGVSRARVVNS